MVNIDSVFKIASFSMRNNSSKEFFIFNLNFDWIANLLGWIESMQSSVCSYSVNSQITDTIYANRQNPASLTIDPHNG